jgi:hypothetical protein
MASSASRPLLADHEDVVETDSDGAPRRKQQGAGSSRLGSNKPSGEWGWGAPKKLVWERAAGTAPPAHRARGRARGVISCSAFLSRSL